MGVCVCGIFSQAWPGIFFFSFLPLPPTLLRKFQCMTALKSQKTLPLSSRTPSNCPLESVLILSPPAASHSQRTTTTTTTTPETPRATHGFGVQFVPRLRQHFIHPRLVHESDEAETPAPRSEEGEAGRWFTRAVSGRGWKGRAPAAGGGFGDSPGSFGQGVPHHQTLLHLPELAEVFAQPFCNHTPAFGPAQARSPSPSSPVLCPR